MLTARHLPSPVLDSAHGHGKTQRDRQAALWVPTTELPTAASHPFYARLNQLLREQEFDDFAEGTCAAFYADTMGRPELAPGILLPSADGRVL